MQIESGQTHWQNSCEVFIKGENYRKVVYGRTREEVVADRPLLARLLGVDVRRLHVSDDWMEQVVVTSTRTIRMGLGAGWARGTRRRNEYGDAE